MDIPPVRGIHIYSSKEWLHYFTCCKFYSSKEWLHYFTCCLTLGIYSKLQCTCLQFCHLKNKKLLYFKEFTKSPCQLYSDGVTNHWYKTTFVLEYDNRNNMQFPSDPRKHHTKNQRALGASSFILWFKFVSISWTC